MKPQFSLATLLVCMTVLTVVAAASMRVPVYEKTQELIPGLGLPSNPTSIHQSIVIVYDKHPATGIDIGLRMAIWGPLAIAATLGVLWTIRRLKSRRHTEPPVGVK